MVFWGSVSVSCCDDGVEYTLPKEYVRREEIVGGDTMCVAVYILIGKYKCGWARKLQSGMGKVKYDGQATE